jgi:hypothetical protein
MEVKVRFHDSCFDFMHRAMASEQGYLNLKDLAPSLNEKDNLSFPSEKVFVVSLPLDDLALKGTHNFLFKNIHINTKTFTTKETQLCINFMLILLK